jgi:coproporphyrinogen III oxidase
LRQTQSRFYPKYKSNDAYFWNAHRQWMWQGGLFFDYCKATETMSMENWFNFVSEVGNSFLDSLCACGKKEKKIWNILCAQNMARNSSVVMEFNLSSMIKVNIV